MPTEKRFLDQNGLIQLLQEIESLDETNIKDFYWSTDNADTYPTVVFKIGDDNGSPHTTQKITFKGDIVSPAPANATTRSITLTINNVDKTITYYDTTGSAGITYTNATDTGDPTAATNVKVALDRVINKLNSMVGTDEKVKQTAQTGSTALPILTAVSGTPSSGANAEAGYDTDFKFTPSSNTLIVKAATSSASGVTITPSSIKVGTTASNGAAELTPIQLKVGSGTLTSTAYSGKATQTETDLAVHSGTNDGATKVGYSSSETGYTGVTTVDAALDQLITDVKNAQDTKEILVLTGNEYGSLMLGSNLSPATYQDTCQKVADAIAQFNTPIFAPDLMGLWLLDAVDMYDDSGNCTEFSLTLRRGTESSTLAQYIHAKKVNGTWVKQDDQKIAVSGDNRSLAGYVSEGMLNTALSEKVDTMVVNVEASASDLNHITIDSIDKTFAEIDAAIQAGKTVIARVEFTGNINGTMILSNATATTSSIMFEGSFLLFGIWSVMLFITASNNTSLDVHQLQLELDSSNAGDNISIATDASTEDIKISALDEKVNQTATTADSDIPMLLANGTIPSNGGAQYDADLKYNPSTNTLKLGTGTLTATNYSGTSAKATADGSGNNIVNTYATKSALDALTQKWTGQFVVLKSTGDTAEKYTALNNILAAIAAGQTPAAADLAKLDLGYIYLLENGSGTNVYDEYIKVAKGTSPETYFVEKIGTTDAGVDVVSIPATGANSVASMFAQYVKNA